MNENCFVADCLVGMLTYSPQDQLDATRFIRQMTATQNGFDRSRVKDAPAVKVPCNRFAGIDFPLSKKDPSHRLYAEDPDASRSSGFRGRPIAGCF